MRSRARTRRGSARSRLPGARCAAGPSATTTSAASVRSVEPAPPPTLDGAELWLRFRREHERDPAHVGALGAAGILLDGPPGDRLRIDRAAFEAQHGLENPERGQCR